MSKRTQLALSTITGSSSAWTSIVGGVSELTLRADAPEGGSLTGGSETERQG